MLTRSGLGAVTAALVLGVCGAWWRYEELVVLAAGIAGAVVTALWSARRPLRARIKRTVATPRVARGDPIRTVYRAVNDGRRRSPPATIVDRCDRAEIRVDLPSIAADDRTEVAGLIPTMRRGVFEIGPWVVDRVDPFGVAVGRRPSTAVGPVIVHPRVHVLHGPYGSMHTVEDEAVVRRAASDPLSGFVSLREYVDGDDPRLIHWPTTARIGTLMLREHVELRRPEFTVVLDAAREVADGDDFEEMVDVAASIAVHALRSGVEVVLRTTAVAFPGSHRPLQRESQVLDFLTSVRRAPAGGVTHVATLFRAGFDATSVVLVTGPGGPSSPIEHAERFSVVRIGRDAVTAVGIGFAAPDAPTFAHTWRPSR